MSSKFLCSPDGTRWQSHCAVSQQSLRLQCYLSHPRVKRVAWTQNKELLAELDAARSRCASLEAESAERDAELQALAQEAATLRTAAERAPGLEEELAASAQRVRVLELAVQVELPPFCSWTTSPNRTVFF